MPRAQFTIPYDAAVEAAYVAGLDPDDAIRPDYSGRGMFGDTCFGLVYDEPREAYRFLIALARELDLDTVEDMLDTGVRQGSMGLGTIAYFPRVVLEGAPEDDGGE